MQQSQQQQQTKHTRLAAWARCV